MPKVTLDRSGQLSRTAASTGMSVGWQRESSGDFLVRVSAMHVQIFLKVVHSTLIIGWPNLKLTPVGGFMGMGTKSEPCYMRGKKNP